MSLEALRQLGGQKRTAGEAVSNRPEKATRLGGPLHEAHLLDRVELLLWKTPLLTVTAKHLFTELNTGDGPLVGVDERRARDCLDLWLYRAKDQARSKCTPDNRELAKELASKLSELHKL